MHIALPLILAFTSVGVSLESYSLKSSGAPYFYLYTPQVNLKFCL
jgi:hypothetical protein